VSSTAGTVAERPRRGYLCLYDEGIALHGYSPEPMNKDQVRGFYQGIFSAFGTPKLEFHEVL